MRGFFAYIIIILFFTANLSAQTYSHEEERVIQESYHDSSLAERLVSTIENEAEKITDDIFKLNINTKADTPDNADGIKPLTYSKDQKWWWNLFLKGKLSLQDTTVIYPKFIKFCVDVYNWADKTFNSYDPEYVEGTGKRWKFRIVNDNWVDGYSMTLPGGVHTWMLSDLYANLGGYLQYMAVSIGYTWDINKLFYGREPSHKKFEFGFNCARFSAEIYYNENTGGTNLRKFGKYNDGKIFKEAFPGVELHTFGLDIYYIFNNKKYSQGAAYNFSKIQKKSQGSLLAGFSYANLKLNFNFDLLPENLKPFLGTMSPENYIFHYNSYSLMIGYGYNWVILPQLLFNVSAMPSLGASHCYEDSTEGEKWLASFNIQGQISATYNLGNYFFSIIGKIKGHWYKSGVYSLFSSVNNFSVNVGLRF